METQYFTAVRILLLGNSNDTGTWFEGGRKRHEILRERLAAEFGEPMEVIVKALWPNERVAELLGGWLDSTSRTLCTSGSTLSGTATNPFPCA